MTDTTQRQPTPRVVVTDTDGLARNTGPAFLVLHIDQQDIRSCNIARTLDRLMVLSDSKENVYRYQGALSFIVAGYDRDKRELVEIPEVRAYFKRLVEEWPHWFWFTNPVTKNLGLILAMLCKVRVIRNKGQGFGTEFANHAELNSTIDSLIRRGSALFDHYKIPRAVFNERLKDALAGLGLASK